MILVDHTYKICNANVKLHFIKLQGKFPTTFNAPHLNVFVPTHTFELIEIIWDIPSHVVCYFLLQNLQQPLNIYLFPIKNQLVQKTTIGKNIWNNVISNSVFSKISLKLFF
jgi:hypothetical protein